MPDTKLTIPTIHIGGSGKAALVKQYRDAQLAVAKAAYAIRDAQDEVQQAYPHGRDYYTQAGATINKAMEEHETRKRAMQTAYDSFLKLYIEFGALVTEIEKQ